MSSKKVWFITGAGRGMGVDFAKAALAAGHAVVASGRDRDRVAKALGPSKDLLAVTLDVTRRADAEAAVRTAVERFGRIDVLVNNAGISPTDDGSVLDTALETWERVQRVNLSSVFLCCKHGIPHLLTNDPPSRGSVINTASFVAVMGAATSQISYTASKGGVLALSRELGVEFARQGVRVNALCPGPVDTPLLRELYAKDPEQAARRLVHLPMGRFARAEEIASAAVFLASDESSYVTASTFLVDGGLSGAYTTPLQ
jgi:NAD(P)-dependent dehydrogenase (short-subunit alcohol dehydrogenase family)